MTDAADPTLWKPRVARVGGRWYIATEHGAIVVDDRYRYVETGGGWWCVDELGRVTFASTIEGARP